MEYFLFPFSKAEYEAGKCESETGNDLNELKIKITTPSLLSGKEKYPPSTGTVFSNGILSVWHDEKQNCHTRL
jgi:hypothetical protein